MRSPVASTSLREYYRKLVNCSQVAGTSVVGMLWGSGWQGELVVVHCNNLAVVEHVNAGYSKDPLLMQLPCCLFFIIAQHISH